MKSLILVIFLAICGIICGVIWCLPLWAIVNLGCLVFHLSFHLSLLQSFTVCLLINVIRNLLFKDITITITTPKEDK